MLLLDGKATAATIRAELQKKILELVPLVKRPPTLAVILVGDDPASQVYVRNKEKACSEIGIRSFSHTLEAQCRQEELEHLIQKLNFDENVDGILLQLPLPAHLESQRCLELISPEKDVDGFHPENMGRLSLGLDGLRPCTPAGALELLQRYNLFPAGKRAVVLGRSNIVGKPLALMLASAHKMGNATVTLCHSQSKDLENICREADFLFAAIGKPHFVNADMVKKGAVVVDVGINRLGTKLVGDCDFESICSKAHAITPVPGGIGPMTIAMLLQNTVSIYIKQNKL